MPDVEWSVHICFLSQDRPSHNRNVLFPFLLTATLGEFFCFSEFLRDFCSVQWMALTAGFQGGRGGPQRGRQVHHDQAALRRARAAGGLCGEAPQHAPRLRRPARIPPRLLFTEGGGRGARVWFSLGGPPRPNDGHCQGKIGWPQSAKWG